MVSLVIMAKHTPKLSTDNIAQVEMVEMMEVISEVTMEALAGTTAVCFE